MVPAHSSPGLSQAVQRLSGSLFVMLMFSESGGGVAGGLEAIWQEVTDLSQGMATVGGEEKLSWCEPG